MTTMGILVIYIILVYQYTQVLGLATDVRLSHGHNSDGVEFKSYEGAIEVLVNDTWGPILRHGVDSLTAKTVCKILGHGLTGFVVEQFSFTGRPLLRSLSCVGNETTIAECTQDPLSGSFEKYDAPGVHCFPQVFKELRLADGEEPNTGTVNIKMDGRWGLLCGYPTGNRFATPEVDSVICRTLGYQRSIDPAPRFGQYGDIYNGWLDIDKITCSGSETNLNQCTVREGTLHRQPRCNTFRAVHCVTDLGEYCTSDDICVETPNAVCFDNICKCKPGYVKSKAYTCVGISESISLLPFTEQTNEGHLQALVDGSLTFFYDPSQNFTDTTAKMICLALRFGFSGFSSRYFYTSSNGPETAAEFGIFECEGNEFSLDECAHPAEFPQRTVSDGQLVNTIHCFDRWIKDVRLVGGDTSYAGQLEVKIGERWGPVCLPTADPSKTPSDATTSVICQSLWNAGRVGYFNTVFSSSGYRIPWINSIECESIHTDINQCNYTIGPQTDMNNNYCSSGGMDSLTWWSCPPIQLVDGPSKHEGRVEVAFYGQQYTLCVDQMTGEIADVICKELNYSVSATNYYNHQEFWSGTPEFFPGTIQCLGNETSLEQCQISNSSDAPCSYVHAIYVHCSALLGEFCTTDDMCAAVENGLCINNVCQCGKGYLPDGEQGCISVTQSIRLLTFTPYDNEGFLQVRVNGHWTLVTGDDYASFTDTTAKMICNALGFGPHGFSSWYHTGYGKDLDAKYGLFECNGTETSLEECFDPDEYPQRLLPRLNGIVTTLHCFDLRIDEVRIVGQQSYFGVVEVKIGDRWGSVCEIYSGQIKSTSDITKEVICNSLRNSGHGGYGNTVSGSGYHLPWLSEIECDAIYDDINECRYITGPHRYSDLQNSCSGFPIRRLSITCPPIQLVNGTSKNVGRIEVGFYGQQYTICGDRMNMALANVTCAVKGFSSVGNIFYDSDFGRGTAEIFQRSIQCAGNETSLELCQISNTPDVLCPSGNVGGVECLIHIGDSCYHRPFACSSISNAECAYIGKCYCKSGYTNVTTRHCEAIYEFRLNPVYTDIYEGVLEVKVNGVWIVVPVVQDLLDNVTASILCKTLGISKKGYTATSNQEVYFEKNVTVLDGLMRCFGYEQDATECNITSGNLYEVSMLGAEWTKIRCSHCENGFYGPHCTICDCNGQSCNVSTGVCMCDPGWEGDTCSTDINECSIIPDICPEPYVCMNVIGSFSCECGPGYKFNGSHCEACEGMYYGQDCSRVCGCEVEHVVQTETNRSCDGMTGHCTCLPEWTGSRCNQTVSSENTDDKMLIIIISSATVGLLLLVVVITVCVCKFRKSDTKGEGKPSINAGGTLNTANEIAMIDLNKKPAVKVETEYDLHRDFLDKPDRRARTSTEAFTGGYDSAGYLKPDQINKGTEYDYTYADKRPDKDPFGYLELDRGKRKLPELPSGGQSQPYEGLKDRIQAEHEYSTMSAQK